MLVAVKVRTFEKPRSTVSAPPPCAYTRSMRCFVGSGSAFFRAQQRVGRVGMDTRVRCCASLPQS